MDELLFLAAGIGYLLGSVSFSALWARLFFRVDLAVVSTSGRATYSALARLGLDRGKRNTWPAMVGEFVKGTVAAYLAHSLSGGDQVAVAVAIIGAAVGHAFPIFFKFRGGKSMSAGGGGLIFIAIQYPAILVIMVVAVIGALRMWKLTNRVSTGSLTAITITAICTPPFYDLGWVPRAYFWMVMLGVVLLYGLFLGNILRLFKGEEHETPFAFGQLTT